MCVCVCVPAGEWLCWPCAEHERALRAAGLPQAQVRPPRWEMTKGTSSGELQGGSDSVTCALCPVRRGAFKRTLDGTEWVHVVGVGLRGVV